MLAAAVCCAAVSSSAVAADGAALAVKFTDCVETIGVDLIATAQAQARVPSPFVLAGATDPVTPIVVRTADCGGIAVDGHPPRAGRVVQIGAVIIPPDFTADIDNYTLWYYTTNGELAGRLQDRGVEAQLVAKISYQVDAGDPHPFSAAVPRPGNPSFMLEGTVSDPGFPTAFTANWWVTGNGGTVKMATQVPDITIGNASLSLMTHQNGLLGQLIGGSSLNFPILQQFNTFPAAHMDVTVGEP